MFRTLILLLGLAGCAGTYVPLEPASRQMLDTGNGMLAEAQGVWSVKGGMHQTGWQKTGTISLDVSTSPSAQFDTTKDINFGNG